MHVQAALQEFLLQLEANGRSPHTIAQYRRHVAALIGWLPQPGGKTDVAALTPGLIASFFTSHAARMSCRGGPKKATSLNAMRTSIRCFAANLHDAGLVPANPARLLRRARCAPPPPKALRTDEQQRLLQVLADARGPEAERDQMLVELLLGTGIRIGSAVGLDVEDVDFANEEIALRVTKNDRPNTLILPPKCTERLRSFIGARTAGPVFSAANGRLSIRQAQRRVRSWLAKARISGRSAHSLRHCFATRLLQRTGDLRLVQTALHHASIASTAIYTTTNRARLRLALGD